jgi:AMP-polyphosphate phosphotransferase
MSILSQVDLSLRLSQPQYLEQLVRYQNALAELGFQAYSQKRLVVMAFEGWDAAGKGGAIKRLTERLDPRGYAVHSIAAPEGEDKTHHYLYRFWRRLPERGQIAIFDRSWYGRVLVERVEGFCTEEEWKRAYREINQFERQLVDFGAILFKFWLQISSDEQLARFRDRQDTPYKVWKLTAEDWRNREKWDRYEVAAEEMLLKTSTITAPWTIVEGNDKWWARVKIVRTVADTLAQELKFEPRALRAAAGGKDQSRKEADPRLTVAPVVAEPDGRTAAEKKAPKKK